MKLIKYASQNIFQDDINSVQKTLKSKYLTQGPKVDEFENKLKKKFKSKYCLVTSSATSALKLSVQSLNLNKKLFIIVPTNTFVATANAVVTNNYKILLAPVNENHGSLDYNCFLKTLNFAKKNKIKIGALINVFYAGQVWDIEKISLKCKKEKILIIDDACHAIGTKYISKKKLLSVGSCKHSNITTFSFHSIKNITSAEGGCVLTNNRKIYNKIKLLRSHGINRNINKTKTSLINFKNEPWFYESTDLSENYRLSDIQCALGISQLKKIDRFKKTKNANYQCYIKEIRKLSKYLKPITKNQLSSTHWHLFPVLINDKYVRYKKALYLFLKKKNIITQVHYIPIYKHPIYQKTYKHNLHQQSEYFYKKIISLPFHTTLNFNEIKFVINQILIFFKKVK